MLTAAALANELLKVRAVIADLEAQQACSVKTIIDLLDEYVSDLRKSAD